MALTKQKAHRAKVGFSPYVIIYAFFGMLFAALPSCAAFAERSCGNDSYIPVERRYTRGLLFKIEKCGEPPSYLFGTVHLARAEVTLAAQSAFKTLPKVQAAGFELGESAAEIAALGSTAMLYPKGAKSHSLQQQLGKKRLAHLLDIVKSTRFDEQMLERMRLWAIAVVLELVGEDPGLPLDEKLRNAAVKMRKPVFGLEKPEDQIKVFSTMPEPMQVRMLKDSIDNHAKLEMLKQSMLDAYVHQDIKKIETLTGTGVALGDDSEVDGFLKTHLIDERNETMEQRLKQHMEGQSVLVAVGAMHLMGDSGILHLLEQDGYRITPLP